MLIADLHIHSKYSRATSSQIDIPNLEKSARQKGLSILGTGDFTHPKWFAELKENLKEDGSGILKTKTDFPFILQTEISLLYSQERRRAVHLILLAPSFDVAEQITNFLKTKGRVDYDGRPIFGIPAPEFVESIKKISNEIELIPAHVWTPWFGLFGSKSGFNSVEECFGDQSKHIFALETGLSSDPAMNWRLSNLDKYSLVSFSDMHSSWPWRMGREATVFGCKPTYKEIIKALRTKEGLQGTIEVNPNYGKYHLDGHRLCGVSFEPKISLFHENVCPKCKKPLTIGVLHRVEELADREDGFKPKEAKDFKSVLPLSELIATSLGVKQVYSPKVSEIYFKLLQKFGNEFSVLLEVPEAELKELAGEKLSRLILVNRLGKIKIKAGYDGVYGEALLDESLAPQKNLTEF